MVSLPTLPARCAPHIRQPFELGCYPASKGRRTEPMSLVVPHEGDSCPDVLAGCVMSPLRKALPAGAVLLFAACVTHGTAGLDAGGVVVPALDAGAHAPPELTLS